MSATDKKDTVILVTSDEENFTVERKVAERSVLIKSMLEDLPMQDTPIPLPNVTSSVLTKVLEYCDHHKNEPLPAPEADADDSRKRTAEIGEWDSRFIQVDQEMLFEIILAANYLDIKPLLLSRTLIKWFTMSADGSLPVPARPSPTSSPRVRSTSNNADNPVTSDVKPNMIKGKTPEQIRTLFNIQNDFTPEEEEQIRRENEWAEDR